MTETTIFSCLEAIKTQSLRCPWSFLLTSPKFASSTRLEVANEAQNSDDPGSKEEVPVLKRKQLQTRLS